MKNSVDLKMPGVQELGREELKEVDGGGQWSWKEASVAFALSGLIGVGFYYLGTQQ